MITYEDDDFDEFDDDGFVGRPIRKSDDTDDFLDDELEEE